MQLYSTLLFHHYSWLWSTSCSTEWISGELHYHNRGFSGVLQL